MAIATTNPNTGKIEKEFDALDDQQIDAAVARAAAIASTMRTTALEQRQQWLRNAASVLRKDTDKLAAIMTTEMGKTFASAKTEVEKCAWVCDFYADEGPAFIADHPIETGASKSFVRYLPIGPVLAVMPWNFPLWQVFRFAAPAMLAGNVGLLKHASNVPQSALAIADVWHRAGVPEDGFQTLLIGGSQVARILKDDRLRAVTLTGSEPAGRSVAEIAGGQLKKAVLELGGSDPFIVMPSADLDHALDMAVKGRTMNNGQSCIAAKRFIVHADIYDTFRDRFAKRLDALKVGDPMNENTDVGPLATKAIRDELQEQVDQSVSCGAKRVTGAETLDGEGWFFKPGMLEEVPESAPAFSEELFGPVAILFKVASLDEAIELGNATRFGLGSALFTNDAQEMQQGFDQLDAGATFINTITASDPRLPFGGVKASGYGRELSADGIREFMNIKTCAIGATS